MYNGQTRENFKILIVKVGGGKLVIWRETQAYGHLFYDKGSLQSSEEKKTTPALVRYGGAVKHEPLSLAMHKNQF